MIIGIDLGTTNSAAAYLSPEGPRLIANALGELLTPSVVALDESGAVLIGRVAKEYAVLHPDRAASVFKRYMGTDRVTKLADRDFTPEQLSSLVLSSLKQDAEAHFGHPVTDVVITVPAYFHDHQRKATINAGKLAGLNVLRIINEPTAAAMAYGFHESGSESVLAVVDLGGGTFDVSVVELFEGTLEVRASAGESILGGEDFTRTIAAQGFRTPWLELRAGRDGASAARLAFAAVMRNGQGQTDRRTDGRRANPRRQGRVARSRADADDPPRGIRRLDAESAESRRVADPSRVGRRRTETDRRRSGHPGRRRNAHADVHPTHAQRFSIATRNAD
ncbi:MAG: Hsp70 family protein [Pirellulales bacterium]